ncbi:MAG: hypothetical protein LBH97_04200 [Treponema sp.]|nr:hypothetical protein [Treponema sp.]
MKNIAGALGIDNPSDIFCREEVLYEIFNRIEMRRLYFHIYHKGIDMGELNEGSLLCFWILKLMPFEHEHFPNITLNVKIAACIFLNMVRYVAAKKNRKANIKGGTVDYLTYAFMFRDLSKEAIMALAESFLV